MEKAKSRGSRYRSTWRNRAADVQHLVGGFNGGAFLYCYKKIFADDRRLDRGGPRLREELTVAIPRSVNATLVERLIFNFRFTPEALDEVLPVTWLKPQVCNGWSVVSFCILDLERVIIAPLPGAFGYRTTSCAYRCGVVDASHGEPANAVYITDRQTNLPIIARLAPWLFLDTILMVSPKVTHESGVIRVAVDYLDGQIMFKGSARPAPWKSAVFPTIEEFGNFIKGGVASYTPSIYGDQLTRVDLHKDEPQYQSLEAEVDMDALDGVWRDAGVILDSAVRASGGGHYKWTYRGKEPYRK